MEKKIPIKTIYLLLVISIGLIGLGIGSTYALFTTSTEIESPIVLSSNLTYTSDILETIEVTIPAGEYASAILDVTNSSGSTLNYSVWYLDEGYDIDVGTGSGTPTGSLSNGSSTSITLQIENNETDDVTIIVGVSSSNESVVLGKGMNAVSSEILFTPLSDFIYILGSEVSTFDVTSYYIEVDDYEYYDSYSIDLETDEILLIKYVGDSVNVAVPSTYVVDGVVYNVSMLSYTYLEYCIDEGCDEETYYLSEGVFANNKNIKSVKISDNIDFYVYGYSTTDTINHLFQGCTGLETITQMPSSITSMSYTFYGCTSLVKAPEIPSSVTNIDWAFNGCTSLTTAPEIPNSVTSMNSTFSGCTSLTTAPELPSSVQYMVSTFSGCTSLTTAPEIPNSVMSMTGTFRDCTSLTGTVRIKSENVSSINYIFSGTSKAIMVQVPVNSTTYTRISALTTSNGMPSNVTLASF